MRYGRLSTERSARVGGGRRPSSTSSISSLVPNGPGLPHEATQTTAAAVKTFSFIIIPWHLVQSWIARDMCPAASSRTSRLIDGRAANAIHIMARSEEHTSELQSLMRISYAVFCLKKKKMINIQK